MAINFILSIILMLFNDAISTVKSFYSVAWDEKMIMNGE
jgi:hypothetical protein